ncbi:thiamine-binding protein [Collinsella vaginalis]|uniref:thiamine-binding protein n=1 Tax=Collinsella vaginalis TaxID=1870987 RepID=UPI000A26B444|nr:thiamine-binding protein [Collinsella vaginalis]
MEASVAIQVLPQRVGGTAEVVRIVDEAIAYIQQEFPDAYVGPFETTIEGEYDHCMQVVAEVNRIVVAAGAPEVATYVKIFFAPEEGVLTTEEKISKYHADPTA